MKQPRVSLRFTLGYDYMGLSARNPILSCKSRLDEMPGQARQDTKIYYLAGAE